MTQSVMKRYRWHIHGIVQGVGFRPHVYRVAVNLGLCGWVQNARSGVEVEAQGKEHLLEQLIQDIVKEAPRLARIDHIEQEEVAWVADATSFEVVHSEQAGALSTMIGPDSATCDTCLHEMLNQADRRYRYAFINCTHCGPRYTLVRHLPYDRAMTSMAVFLQCPACEAEYRNPLHRRFHAEPNACPVCGPQLTFQDHTGVVEGDPIAITWERIQKGEIVAMKGIGGFHLACDANNAQTVHELRKRKNRPDKPFALMMLNSASIRQWCEVSEPDAALLDSVEHPIVLLPWKEQTRELFQGVAPNMDTLGIMLPYTPLHFLLFYEALGRPTTLDWLEQPHPLVLVMTSANPGGEPLVIDNEEALDRLAPIADSWLLHNREIVSRCDDSVIFAHSADGQDNQLVRRSRGYAPAAILLKCHEDAPSVLAMGGFFKNTFCVTRGNEAFLSPHIGDLDHAATCQAFDENIEHFLSLLEVRPEFIAHDAHPDFYSTQAAARLAAEWGIPLVEVHHHHAHIAGVMAERQLDEPVLGLAFDGVGLGVSEAGETAIWGGELLLVEGAGYKRVSHLSPLFLAGGDRAAKEPWRLAASVLAQSGRADEIERVFAEEAAAEMVGALLTKAVKQPMAFAPQTTSMGRWFDAAAAALNICTRMSFEGQAAMSLEVAANQYLKKNGQLPCDPSLYKLEKGQLNLISLVAQLFEIDDTEYGAALFHGTLIAAITAWVTEAAHQAGIQTLAGSGGCWVNRLLSSHLKKELQGKALQLWNPRLTPANDGGLSLGQAWVALQKNI